MIDSPYRPGFGARPAVMVGREKQLRRAVASLVRTANSRSVTPSVLVLTGSRGVGKTVTLAAIADEASNRGFVRVSAAFDSVGNNSQLLSARLAEQVVDLDPERHGGRVADLWQRIRRRLGALSVEVNAGIVKVASSSTASGTPDAQSRHIEQRESLTALLLDGARLAVESGRTGLCVCIDELQEAPHEQLVVFANAIQDALKVMPSTPLAVFAAGLPNTPDRVMRAASFTERFDFRTLPALTADESTSALLDPALALGVTWASEAATAVLEAASGSPYLIQRLGDESWLRASPAAAGDVISPAAAIEAVDDTWESLATGMFRGRWEKATSAEQDLLAAIAHVAGPEGIAASADITRALDRTTPQLSTARRRLMDKGLIESAGQGRLRFTMPGFGAFVLEQSDPPSRPAP